MTEGINVQIDPEAVNKMVSEAIIGSALGEQIEKAIQEALKPAYGGKGIVEQAIGAAVHEQVRIFARETVRSDEIAGQIKQAIMDRLTPEKLGEMADEFVKQLGLIQASDF